MVTLKSLGMAAYRVFIGLAPNELPKSITRSYDFTGGATSIQEDLSVAQETDQIEWIQAIYVDNSMNAQPVTVFFPITQQNITIAPYQQGYVPVLCVNPPKFIVSTTGAVIVNMCLMNFAVPADTWDAQIKPVQVSGYTGVDGSGTITTGGTAQNLFGGTIPTDGFEVDNPDATNDLWISLSTTALANGSGSIRVSANGGKYTSPSGMAPFHAISIVGGVTGQKFTAVRW